MNIYDCFMYYDEDLLLDIRLNALNKYVKKFVITEATYTHNGTKKKLNFNINNFNKFKNKIDYIVVDQQPPNVRKLKEDDSAKIKEEKLILNGMARDYFQRENLKKGLKNLKDDDLVVISDLDEIPNFDNLDFDKINNNIIIFQQKMFYYKLNLYYNEFIWAGSKAVKYKNFVSPQWLRNVKSKKYPFWRLDVFFSKKKYSNLFYVKDGGWHFTCIRTPEDLEKKLLNFAHHYEFEQSGLKISDIKKLINEKRVMYDHNIDQKGYKWSGKSILKKINLNLLPSYIANNAKRFDDWLD
jgi:beta-1,4-mannosyl-glycoprotein beta-1,4-N-acetylglucosaminyltransferase